MVRLFLLFGLVFFCGVFAQTTPEVSTQSDGHTPKPKLEKSIFFDGAPEGCVEREPIIFDGIQMDYLYTPHADIRETCVWNLLKLDSKKVISRLTPTHWLFASCDSIRSFCYRGGKKEYMGTFPKDSYCCVFIPTSFVDGSSMQLDLLLHRAISVAVYNVVKRIISKYNPEKAKKTELKWINDVLVDRKKICGISWDYLFDCDDVVCYRSALNVNRPRQELAKIDQPATSLAVECGREFDQDEISREVAIELISVMKKYQNDLDGLDRLFSSKMAFVGEKVIVYDAVPGKNVTGVLEKVEYGMLYIKTESGEVQQILPGTGILRKVPVQ